MIEASYGPLKGMPEVLPEGEHLVWQGRPAWWSLAKSVFHIRAAAGYFGLLLIWRVALGLSDGFAATGSLKNTILLTGVSVGVLCILALLAWVYSRTTVYSITNRRVVMHIGVALPVALNLPYGQIGAAATRIYPNGTADIALTLLGDDRIAYLHLWPHARPWQLRQPQPMLRCIADGERVAALLSRELKAAQPDHVSEALSGAKTDERMPGHLTPAAA
jgi:Bacterial PH domain